MLQALRDLMHLRGFRFADDEMEALYQLNHMMYARQVCFMWCVLEFVAFLCVFIVRCFKYDLWTKPSAFPFVQQILPLVLIVCLATAVYFLPWLRRHIQWLLCLSALFLVGLVLWGANDLVSVRMERLKSNLTQVWSALHQNTEATTELMNAFMLQETRLQLCFVIIQCLLLFNLLQFLGLNASTGILFLSLPIAMVIMVYSSPIVANEVPEAILYASLTLIYTVCASFQMLTFRRRQFDVDYTLQEALKREAHAMREMAQREKALKEASIEADSILNHILKNVMADAAGCVFLFLETHKGRVPPDLKQAMSCLDRGMNWCRKRQAIMRITSGNYAPAMVAVHLREFGESLIQGRRLACRFLDEVVILDPILCDIVLDNAINNAFRHGDTAQQPIGFAMELQPEGCATDVDSRLLTFEVTNHVRRDRPPLTQELVQEILAGQQVQPNSVLSEHLGLKHLFMAAEVHNMELQLEQQGDVVTLRASLMVRVEGTKKGFTSETDRQVEPLPEGIKILCIDDSDVARRLLAHVFNKHTKNATVRVLGETPVEVEEFKEEALRGADILVLDNHLGYGHVRYLGTHILEELNATGFHNFACIRSANVSAEDRAQYFQSGAHCVVGKDTPPHEMVNQVRVAYMEFLRKQRTQSDLSSPAAKQIDPPLPHAVASPGASHWNASRDGV